MRLREAMQEKIEEKVKPIHESDASERKQEGDKLVESWSKKKGIGEGLVKIYEKSPEKARDLAFVLKWEEKHLGRLTETQISTAFSTTPENVMKIVRLGYPNSVRGDVFLEWSMQTTRDSMYYLYPVYDSAQRGSTINQHLIESSTYRYSTEIVQDINNSLGNGSQVTFTSVSSSQSPIVPYSVRVYVGNVLVGNDNGSGVFPASTGEDLVPNQAGETAIGISSGTINYTTGQYSIVFTSAPASGAQVIVEYNYNSEVSTNYGNLGLVDLQLRDYQFRVRPYPLGVSWSKMTELLLGTTLNIDAEEALIRGAADELKKSLDFQALRLGYTAAYGNSSVSFDGSPSAGGEDSTIERAQAITNAIDQAGDIMFNLLQRGGVTKIYGGPNATSYLKLHKRFDASGAQPKVGAHRLGSIDQIDIFKVPNAIVPQNELVAVYRNDEMPEDVSIACGTLIPLYKTQKLEYKNLYSEQGLAHFGDLKVLQPGYLVRIVLSNLPLA